MKIEREDHYKKNGAHEKVLLLILPYWTPLIPPMGVSCLKAFLQKHGFIVSADDANVRDEFKKIYHKYFNILKETVPESKRGNFFSIGHDVLQNHMTAYLNREKRNEIGYIELVKTLVFKTFYSSIEERRVWELDKTIGDFYNQLEKYLLDLLDKERPAVLGISVYSCTLPASLFAVKLTRKIYPGIKTVIGGGIFCDQLAMGTPNLETLLKETKDYLDKIIIGEGELLFLKLLRGELPESQRVYTVKDISSQTLDLSSVDVPDFSGLNLQLYPYLSAYGSRSCPFECSFCSDSVMWGKFRKKKSKQIVEEFKKLYQKHEYQLFMMSDLLLNPFITDLANEIIASGLSIYWDGCLRADKNICSIKNTQLWRHGGFYRARLGLESGSPRVLELMGKKLTVEQIKQGVSSLAFAGIQTTTLWIVGHPGETEEDFLQTLELIEDLKNDIYEAECRPFYYYLTGQVASDQWQAENKSIPLYPPEAEKILLFQTWILDSLPSREETYKRVSRFVEHCNKLGIPNIYSLHNTYKADERWKKLHKNAVPSLLEFKKEGLYIDESKHFEETYLMQDTNTNKDDGDFNFLKPGDNNGR